MVLREQPFPDGVREDNEDMTSYWAAETSFRDVMVSINSPAPPFTRLELQQQWCRYLIFEGFDSHRSLALKQTTWSMVT